MSSRQPGEGLLDQILPNADQEERNRACTAFLAYGRHLLWLADDLARTGAAQGPGARAPGDGTMGDISVV